MYGIQEIDIDTLQQWRGAGKGFVLLDVRTPAEMARGVIGGASLMPMHLLPVRLPDLRDRTPLVIYCRTGARSAQACAYLAQHGLTEVYNLRGGIVAWAGAGLAVEPPEPEPVQSAAIS